MFSGTIQENIAHATPHASAGEITAAAKSADTDDFIARLTTRTKRRSANAA